METAFLILQPVSVRVFIGLWHDSMVAEGRELHTRPEIRSY